MKQQQERTKAQVLGDIGEITVQLIFTKFGWTSDIIKSDYGEDIDVNIFIDSLRTNYHFRCQVKSTTRDSEYVRKTKNGSYSVQISSSILKAWLTSYFPVFVVIYDEDLDVCYWCNPIKEILENPAKLERVKPTVTITQSNILNELSKDTILFETTAFYNKFLRLDEAKIECNVIPLIMPHYRVIPFHLYHDFRKATSNSFHSYNVEMLPSWMSVLKQINPVYTISAIKIDSNNTNLEVFINYVKDQLSKFSFEIEPDEWLSFIVSPIKIQSQKSLWFNEVTSWATYAKINDVIVDEYGYNFDGPENFLEQAVRRARSWDNFNFVDPRSDISLQFYSAHSTTPTIQIIDETHIQNIKGQFLLWKCHRQEIEVIQKIIADYELVLRIIENNDECLVAIADCFFEPALGTYSNAMDWASFERGKVRNILEKNDLINLLPGCEFSGPLPNFLEEFIDKFREDSTNVIVSEMTTISPIPLLIDRRIIEVSRLQLISEDVLESLVQKIENVLPSVPDKYKQDYIPRESFFEREIVFQLYITWSPETFVSSKDAFLNNEQEILELFNIILPSSVNKRRNTLDILRFEGEIEFR